MSVELDRIEDARAAMAQFRAHVLGRASPDAAAQPCGATSTGEPTPWSAAPDKSFRGVESHGHARSRTLPMRARQTEFGRLWS